MIVLEAIIGKYIKNGLAYLRAIIFKLLTVLKKVTIIGNRVRIFCQHHLWYELDGE